MENDEKLLKNKRKMRKIRNGIYCCYNIGGAVFRVQSLLLNIEIFENKAIKLQKNRRKIIIVHTVVDKINIMF